MAQDGLKAVLERLGLKQAELARLLDVSPRTVSQWATGDQPLPGPVAGYLRLLESADPARRHNEFERLGVRAKTLDEGIYRVVYRGADDGDGDTALAVLRNGKILGSDPHGGVFMGSYSFDAENDLNTVHLRLTMPPHGELVNGYTAGPKGATLELVGSFHRAAPTAKTTIEAGGAPLVIELSYLGSLPN